MGELTQIDGIGGATAKKLREQGIETPEDLAGADPDAVSVPTGNVATLIERAQQANVSEKTAADLLAEYQAQEYVTTGVPLIDAALDGGWECGTVTMIYGKSGTSKSQLAFSSLTAASAGGPVIYVQTENQPKAVAERWNQMADGVGDLSNITVLEAYDVEEQYATFQKIDEEYDGVDLIVVDSLTAQFRMSERYDGRENLGKRSSDLGRHLRKLGEIAREKGCSIVTTGQVYGSPDAYSRQDTPWGGEKMKHFISYFLRMSEGQGNLKKATLENHPGLAEAEVLLRVTDSGVEGVEG